MNELLDEAKKLSKKNRNRFTSITKDEVELAVAYLRGEISRSAGAEAVNTTNTYFTSFVASALKHGFESRMINIELL